MTPSQTIVKDAHQTIAVGDKKGRRLTVRRLTALDTLRLFKAAGPTLAQNEPWLSMAGLAFSVLEIDRVPVPAPTSEQQIENLVERLGDEGLTTIADVMRDGAPTTDFRTEVGTRSAPHLN